MSAIRVTGRLVCRTEAEAAIVTAQLPAHVERTRAEPGCLAFTVLPTDDPLVWSVDEEFLDRAAFDAHARRIAASEWGRATAGIERRYSVLGTQA